MPSSGVAGYSINRNELIEASLRVLRVLREGDVPNATQIRYANTTLNMLVKNMQSNGLQLWTYQLLAIPLVVGQQSYTIGPTGADVTSTRPLRLFDGSYIRTTTGTCTYDTPLRMISRLEYLQFGAKGSQSIPNSIYYHPGIDLGSGLTSPSTGYGTLYVYATLSDAAVAQTIYCNFQRPIYDMNAADQEFDLPQEWFRCLKFLLARDLAFEYRQIDPQWMQEIREEAKRQWDELQDWTTETAPVYFQPDQQTYMHR